MSQGALDWPLLMQALESYTGSYEKFNCLDDFRLAAVAQQFMAKVYFERLKWKNFDDRADADQCLQHLKTAEFLRSRTRLGIAPVHGVQSIQSKQLLRREQMLNDCNSMAISICLAQKRFETAWDWIQLSKSRSLSDMLAIGLLMPQYLRERIDSTEMANELLE